MIGSERAIDFVQRRARVRVYSGGDMVMAEGRVFAYSPAPTLHIEHDDGTRSSWSVDLTIVEVPEPVARPAIPDFMRLSGDEDGGVSLTCYKDSCDPYYHGSVAYYSGSGALLGKPYFASLALGDFLAFVAEHAASHTAAPDGGEPR